MKKSPNILTLVSALLLCTVHLLCSCENDADFSNDSSLRLSYSIDTLKFEPLVTEQTTSTRTIVIRNNSGEDLRISSVELESHNGNFQMNADGKSGEKVSNLEIRDGDSIYVFVRANLNQLADNNEVWIEDAIVINYNDHSDRIIITALGQNAVVLRNHTVTKDTIWTSEQPFLIFDSLKIAEGTTLTMEAGTIIRMHNQAIIDVNGSIVLKGTASAPVIISGDRYDNLTSNIPYLRLPGQWNGIHFSGSSSNNMITGAWITGMTSGIVIDSAAINPNEWRLQIINSEIRVSQNGVLIANNANIGAANSVFANGGSRNVELNGGAYQFVHCTICNLSTGNRWKPSLCINASVSCPILECTFANSIIAGSQQQEIEVSGDSLATFNFHNSLVFTATEDSIHYKDCVRNQNPQFDYDNSKRIYDFHIDSTSAARYIGNPTYIMQVPVCAFDLEGNNRMNDSLPDAGAYTWMPTTK